MTGEEKAKLQIAIRKLLVIEQEDDYIEAIEMLFELAFDDWNHRMVYIGHADKNG